MYPTREKIKRCLQFTVLFGRFNHKRLYQCEIGDVEKVLQIEPDIILVRLKNGHTFKAIGQAKKIDALLKVKPTEIRMTFTSND